jgi:O-methyltransferase
MPLIGSFAHWARFAAKSIAFETPLARVIGARYAYNFRPNQLAFLCACITEVADVPGCVVEAGCFAGATTVYLGEHMRATGVDKPYYALDTFAGFIEAQRQYEVAARDKNPQAFGGFALNSKRWFDRTMQINQLDRVTSLRADVGEFDFSSLAPIAFCLLDVDLYLPTKAAIPRIYESLSPGGILVVDDCLEKNIFDGACQAYGEFVRDSGLLSEIRHVKLGVIRKPR